MDIPQSETPAMLWEKACSFLKRELSERSFQTWFGPVSIQGLSDDAVTLSVPDSYYGKWLEDHYQNLIESCLQEALGRKVKATYVVVNKSLPVEKQPPQIESSPFSKMEGILFVTSEDCKKL